MNISKKYGHHLRTLHEQSWFQELMGDLDKESPRLPLYDPNNEQHDEMSWAYFSGQQEGYKLALSHLGVKINE